MKRLNLVIEQWTDCMNNTIVKSFVAKLGTIYTIMTTRPLDRISDNERFLLHIQGKYHEQGCNLYNRLAAQHNSKIFRGWFK